MGKHSDTLPGFHKPKIEQVDEKFVTGIVQEAVPLTDFQLLFHPATLSVYVCGRHPLGVHRTIIRVPVSRMLAAQIGILQQLAVPMLDHAEKVGAGVAEPPDKPAI